MSELEQKVRPFLAPMLTHDGDASLSAEQQRDLARWAIVKALLLELSIRQQHAYQRTKLGYTPSDAELAWLAMHPDPPPRSRVWLGAFDAQGEVTVTTRSKQFSTPEAGGQHSPLPSHLTTITIGYVLFQVFSIDYVLADVHTVPEFDGHPPTLISKARRRIWPFEHASAYWPPEATSISPL